MSLVIAVGIVVLGTSIADLSIINDTENSFRTEPSSDEMVRITVMTSKNNFTNAPGTTNVHTATVTRAAASKDLDYIDDYLYEDLNQGNEAIFRDANNNGYVIRGNATPSTTHTSSTTGDSTTNINSPINVEVGAPPSIDDPLNSLDRFKGDLVGWRKVDIREFPYVVSLMHAKYKVHLCTGTLFTSKIVLSYMRCVVRRKVIAEKVLYTMVDAYQIVIAAGFSTWKGINSDLIYRDVDVIITAFDNAFNGQLVFLILNNPIPYSIYHRPVKMYSMIFDILRHKLQDHVGKTFCEVITWEDTIICSDSRIKRPKHLKAYKVKILDEDVCSEQDFRLGVRSIGEWTLKTNATQSHCFVGLGGRRCGSSPGAPVVCGNAIFGIMTMGTSCSEFGDYTYFIPLNNTELYLLYKQAIEYDFQMATKNSGWVNIAFWILPMLYMLHLLTA